MGELFDRATTLYVRYFRVFVLITLTLSAPMLLIANAIAPSGDGAVSLAQEIRQIEHPNAAHPLPPPFTPAQMWGFALFALFVFTCSPLVQGAIGATVRAAESGEVPTYAQGFSRALARWAPLILTMLLYVLAFIGIYLAAVIIGVVAAIALVLLAKLIPGLGIVLAVIAGTALVLAFLFALLLVSLSLYLAIFECAAGTGSAGSAMAFGFRSVFTRAEIKRASLIACFIAAISIAGTLLSATASAIVGNSAYGIVQVLLGVIISAILGAYTTVLMAVYYLEVRKQPAVSAAVPDVAAQDEEPEPIYADTRYATGDERRRIHHFLDNRQFMTPAQRADTAADLAALVRPRVPADLARLDDEALLERL